MATWYISTTGNDTTGNGSVGSPWATLAKAIASSALSDTIYCASGTYTALPSAIPARNIIASTIGGAVFDGSGATANVTVGTDLLETTITGLVFRNFVSGSYGIFRSAYGTMNTFDRCVFSGFQMLYRGANQDGGIVSGSWTLNKYAPFTINGCLGFDLSAKIGAPDPVILFGNRANSIIKNSTFQLAGTWFYGIVDFTSGKLITCANNIFDSLASVPWGSAPAATPIHCCYHNVTSFPSGTGNINADPLFWDAPNGDFRLRAKDGSGNPNPVLGAGVML